MTAIQRAAKHERDEMRDKIAFIVLAGFRVDKEDVHQMQSGARIQGDVSAKFCYDVADAFLKEREKRQGKNR